MIGFTLNLMNTGLQEFHAASQPWDIHAAHPGVAVQSDTQHLPARFALLAQTISVTVHPARSMWF